MHWYKNPEIWIYVSHILSSWGDRMYTFAVGLYLVLLWNDSLLLTAVLGFSICITGILFGALIGEWIDKTKRIKVAKIAIVAQNSCVFVSAILIIVLILFREEIGEIWTGITLGLIIIISVMGELASLATKISLEKDWIVVLADGDETKLSRMNSIMRTLNLTAYILAPITIGNTITYGKKFAGAIFVAVWNILSAIVEISLLQYIYKSHPKLGQKMGSGGFSIADPEEKKVCCSFIKIRAISYKNSWREYWHQPIRNSGLGLASMYMTVLAFDNITRGYLYGQGLSESVLGVFTAFGAAFGIMASISYPFMIKRLNLAKTGTIGYTLLVATLILCLVSVFVQGSPFNPSSIKLIGGHKENKTRNGTKIEFGDMGEFFGGGYNSDILLLIGVVISRFGLWLADLSITQIFQKETHELKRGVVSGVQSSLNQLMNLLKFGLVMILPRRDTFGYLIFLSWIFIFGGYILYLTYACKHMGKEDQEEEVVQEESALHFEDDDGNGRSVHIEVLDSDSIESFGPSASFETLSSNNTASGTKSKIKFGNA